jgi:hypothetical protein
MFEPDIDFGQAMNMLKRADATLREFVAPVWPGLKFAAVWIDKKPRGYFLPESFDTEKWVVFERQEDDSIKLLRDADPAEIEKFLNFMPKFGVHLIGDGMVYPAELADKMRGISGAMPALFAPRESGKRVQVRFDGVNIFFDGEEGKAKEKHADPFAGSALFDPGDSFALSGKEECKEEADKTADALKADKNKKKVWTMKALVKIAKRELKSMVYENGKYHIEVQDENGIEKLVIEKIASPVTTGISLGGSRDLDVRALTRKLQESLIMAWRSKEE